MATRLDGKAAIVTGSGRGIGRAIALALAKEGANLVVNGVTTTPEEGSDLAPVAQTAAMIDKAGGTALVSYDSVADFRAAERLVKLCVDTFGRVDILVNNAGVVKDRMIHKMPEEEWDAVIAVHLKGTFNTIRHASPFMIRQGYGRIINTTSQSWLGMVAGQANYAAAKGGIVSLTYEAAGELARHGITVNAIAPMAATRINTSDTVRANFKRQLEAGLITRETYDELMDMPGPEFVAPLVAYLATDESRAVTGKVFACGGGQVSQYSNPVKEKVLYRDYRSQGPWTIDELARLVPEFLHG